MDQQPQELALFYMRDNHTFKRLTNDVRTAVAEVAHELDSGYTHGMLCTKSIVQLVNVHARGGTKREEFLREAEAWVTRALEIWALRMRVQ